MAVQHRADVCQGVTFSAGGVIITFYLLFYFLPDRFAARTMIKAWLPLAPPEADRWFRRSVANCPVA